MASPADPEAPEWSGAGRRNRASGAIGRHIVPQLVGLTIDDGAILAIRSVADPEKPGAPADPGE